MNWGSTVRPLRRKSLLGQFVVLALGVQVLFFGSFIALQMPVPTSNNINHFLSHVAQETVPNLPPTWAEHLRLQFPQIDQAVPPTRFSPYVALAPLAIFIGYVLGVPLGFMATAIFLLLGLAGPYCGLLPLAAGGGLDYYRQPSFGYLLGMILGSWLAGRLTLSANRSSVRQLLAIGGGLLLVHVCGLTYLFGSALTVLLFEGQTALWQWQPWLFEQARNLSWYALPYDLLFALIMVGLGFPFRSLVDILTAADNVMKPKPKWDGKLPTDGLQVPRENQALPL